MKIAVAVGPASRFVVGEPAVQLIDVLAGALIDDLAAAEQHARQGEVVLDESVRASLGDRVDVAQPRSGPDGRSYVRALAVRDRSWSAPPVPPPGTLPPEQVRPWLLPAVYERMRAGGGEFLAELRPGVPLFLRFGGIDFDDSTGAREALDDFIVRAQHIIDGYGGNALQLTIGDKGAYLYAVFGSPIAHEDDPSRACAAALELIALEQDCAVSGVQIGIAHGQLRSGTYGHARRRTFCCLGDAVNLAARLMAKAPAGGIYVSEDVRRMTADMFDWVDVGPVTVKGKAVPVAVHALRAHYHRRTRNVGTARGLPPMVGRTAELELISSRAQASARGAGQIVGIRGEAGLGKSRLLVAVGERLATQGLERHIGGAHAFGARTSYGAWRDVVAGLLAVPDQASTAEQIAVIEAAVAMLDPDLLPRAPLLGAVLGVPIPDTALTAALDAKLRKSSTELLIAQLLDRIIDTRGPLVLQLEDCTWLDPLSTDLLDVVLRSSGSRPILVMLTYRPFDAVERPAWLGYAENCGHFVEVALSELDLASARQLIETRFADLFGRPTPAPEPVAELVLRRGGGNPFFIEELLSFIAMHEVDPTDPDALARIELPSSLNSLVLSRIDVLPESPRRTVKVASVLGREFQLADLLGTYPSLGSAVEVGAHLEVLRQANLVVPDMDAFGFRHVMIRDVAYESLPFALRRELHGNAAHHIEGNVDDGAAPLDLLAYHYWFSDDEANKRRYLVLAGEAAQAAYANQLAIDYFRRAVGLLSGADRGPILRKLGKVLELVGSWDEAETAYRQALELAAGRGDRSGHARARTALAEVARKQGNYDDAGEALAEARAEFEEIGDAVGLGEALHIAGTLAAQQGSYALARTNYRASLAIRQDLADRASVGSLLSNLAILSEYQEDYAQARRLNEESLAIRVELGDRWAIGVSLNNLGMIALLQDRPQEAHDRFVESMRLHREVGDLWMVALGHNNLGNAMRRLSRHDEAGRNFAQSLRDYRLFGERWGLAILYEDIALFAVDIGDDRTALLLDGAATAMRSAIGSPRAPSQQQTLDEALTTVRRRLGADADAVFATGTASSDEEIYRLVLEACGSG